MKNLYTDVLRLLQQGQWGALATVVKTRGSTPQKVGAQAIFLETGRILGTVGGGCLEAEVRRRAMESLQTGETWLFDLHLNDDFGWDDGLICGGTAQVFVEPLPAAAGPLLEKLTALVEQRQPAVLTTVVKAPDPALVGGRALAQPDGSVEGAVPEALREALAARTAEVLAGREPVLTALPWAEGAEVWLYSEPLRPRPELIICGAGHIGGALCHLGAWLDFEVIVIDDRSDFANAERLPEADRILVGDPAEELGHLLLGPDSYVVIVTRGHRHDAQCLRACIRSNAGYLGMIGSRRKVQLLFEELRQEGLASPEELERVHAPIGLNIGGTTVEEIAVSIAAELISVRSGRGDGRQMSGRSI